MRYALLLLAACGGGGGGDDGSGSGSSDAPLAPGKTGYVSIQSYDAMNTPNTPTRGGTASAAFFSSGAFCTTTQTIGPCEVATCTSSQPPAISAGTIMISGAAMPITMTPTALSQYDTFMTASPLFSGGESITFAAAGAGVPAFSGSVTMPSKATITVPAKPSNQSPYLVINRGADYTVSWTGGGSGQVQVALNSQMADKRLFCRFDASAGTGKIPSAALATLDAGGGGFAMASVARKQQTAGEWGVELSGYFNAVWPDLSIVSGPTNFQ
ncbi:MAG TPA: hypothetical protein VIV40_06530 [Kofleriaceae bacterium]